MDLNRINETFESFTGSAIPRVIFSDNDLTLKGMQAASDFLLGSTVIDENGVLEAVMDDIVSLPLQNTPHVSKSVRPLLAEVLMNALKHAQYNGIWGFSAYLLLLKQLFVCLLEVEGENVAFSAL